jgi:hypothetical protein
VEIAQVPVYLAGLWLLTTRFGIAGTAIAWTGRILLDTVILFWFSDRLFPHQPKLLLKLGLAMAGALAVLWLATFPDRLLMKALFLSAALPAFVVVGWYWALGSSERAFLAGTRSRTLIQSQYE